MLIRHDGQIRVAHVVPSSFGRHFGGQTRYLYSLLSGWHDPDIRLSLVGTELKPVNMNSGDREYRLPTTEEMWSDPRAARRLDGLRESVRVPLALALHSRTFDIAHFHYLGWGPLLGSAAIHLLGKRVVCTLSLYGDDNPGEIARGKGPLALELLRRFDGVVALSPALAEDCRKHAMSNVVTLPNFLPIPELEVGRSMELREAVRVRLQIPSEASVLLFIGAAILRKGLDVLIESYIRVAEKKPGTWLVLVGPCTTDESHGVDAAYVAEQQRRLRDAGKSDHVIWVGMVADKRELVGYYSAADVFVLPTRREGSPNVLVEAMAAGLPVVATNLPGCTDAVVVDGETGFLVPPDGVDALTRAVMQLLSEPSLLARMGFAAHVRSRLFSFDGYCRRLRDFYIHVMRTRPQ